MIMNTAEKIKQKAKSKFSWRILWENFVFEENGKFYKMPAFWARNTMYRKNDSYEKLLSSLKIIKKYFWPLTKIPKTDLFCDNTGHYIIQQSKVQGEKLTKKHMRESPKLLSKFRRLVIANELMWESEEVFLDLLGSDILTKPNTIHNLLTDGENIYIFDFGLLEKKSSNFFFKHFSKFGKCFQLVVLKKFF